MCIPSTDIAAESAESRTVFSITCNCHAALRRHTANSSSDSSSTSTSAFAVPAVSETTENSESRQQHTATCQLRTHSSARQQSARFCKLRKATKTKSYVFLLVILSAILVQTSYATPVTLSGKRLVLHTSEYRERYHQELLQKERERVQPTPHRHHMHLRSVADINIMSGDSNYNSNDQPTANGNGNGAEQGYCQTVVGALRKTQKQADTTYQTVRNYLDEYAKHQYQNKTREVYRMWQKHELKLSHPYRDALVRDFDKTPDMSHFAHIVNEPISRSMIVTEMEKVYKTLKTLEQVLGDLLQSRKENESQLRHDYGAERLAFINKYFVEAYRHVGIELEETKQAMMKLKIPVPSFDEPISYNHTSPAKEWLVAVEHLSVMQYLRQLYEVLLSKCAAGAE